MMEVTGMGKGSASDPTAAGGITPDRLAARAAGAWRELRLGAAEPDGIELLRWRSATGRKVVFRLSGVGLGGTAVIAKRCRKTKAAIERTIYEEVFPHLRLPVLRCYGAVGEADDQFCWLFLEDVGGIRYSALVEEHRRLAARWLGILHTSTERPSVESRLPDRGPGYFLECLRSARVRIRGALANPCLSTDDLGVLEAILSRCEGLESRWDRVEGLCAAMPRTIVHGDFKEKNVQIRAGASGAELLPYDWACAGVGVPAIDLAQPSRPSRGFSCHPDLEAYWVVVRERWPALDLQSVRRWAILGTILRSLAALSWAAPGLSHTWVDKPMIEMRFYLSSIGGALEGTDLI